MQVQIGPCGIARIEVLIVEATKEFAFFYFSSSFLRSSVCGCCETFYFFGGWKLLCARDIKCCGGCELFLRPWNCVLALWSAMCKGCSFLWWKLHCARDIAFSGWGLIGARDILFQWWETAGAQNLPLRHTPAQNRNYFLGIKKILFTV